MFTIATTGRCQCPLFSDVILKSNSEMFACRPFSLFCRCLRVVSWRFNVCLCFSSSWMEPLCPSLICWWVSNVTSCAISGHSTLLVSHAVLWEANLLLIYSRIVGNKVLYFLWPNGVFKLQMAAGMAQQSLNDSKCLTTWQLM